MGDPNQPIDRYDGRATIHDLKPFESLKDIPEPEQYLTKEEVTLSIKSLASIGLDLYLTKHKNYFLLITSFDFHDTD